MKQIIDITYPIYEGMPTFGAPWHPLVSITQMGRHGFEGRETRKITLGTHTGTQIDAPLHFVSGGKSIDKIPLGTFFGEVSIIDFSHLSENEMVTVEHLKKRPLKKRIIFKFGRHKYWDTKFYYKNYPYFSKEAAEFLTDQKVKLIGMDTPSPDDSRIILTGDVIGSANDSPIHKIFLRNNIILIEYLNLKLVKDFVGWNLAALPLKIKGADGSPARVCLFK